MLRREKHGSENKKGKAQESNCLVKKTEIDQTQGYLGGLGEQSVLVSKKKQQLSNYLGGYISSCFVFFICFL